MCSIELVQWLSKFVCASSLIYMGRLNIYTTYKICVRVARKWYQYFNFKTLKVKIRRLTLLLIECVFFVLFINVPIQNEYIFFLKKSIHRTKHKKPIYTFLVIRCHPKFLEGGGGNIFLYLAPFVYYSTSSYPNLKGKNKVLKFR